MASEREKATKGFEAAEPAQVDNVLTQYGDVPVAYAVFRVHLNEDRTEVVDTEYVHVNALYRKWQGWEDIDLEGRSFLETAPNASAQWFPYCYRAAVLHEELHDVIYSPEIESWLRFDVKPSSMEGCCVFAFSQVDEEHRKFKSVEAARDTSDFIIEITKALNDRNGYEDAMNGLLETMSRIIHPERLYIFERWEHTSSNTFEWCAPGVEPQIELLQNLDNSEFDTWDRMLATDSVVVIPDVSAYKGVDDRLYELLTMQGIDRLLAVPFYEADQIIGYLGADNYALDERLDTHRLLETVASFVCARMKNRRLMDELEQISTHDSLTGLLNRRGIDTALEKHLEQAPGEPFVLALMDVDDFKTVNDMYGHAVGDEALRTLATRLRDAFPADAVIGRNGGDEALVALPGKSAQDIDGILTKLIGGDLACELNGTRYALSISAGYTWCTGFAEDLTAAYSRADAALYTVKHDGKSDFARFAPGMETRFRMRLSFTSRNVAGQLPEAVAVCEPHTGKILFANDALASMLGYQDVHELVDTVEGELSKLVDPEDRSRVMRALECPEGEKARLRLRMKNKQGTEREVLLSGRQSSVGAGKSVLYAVIFDLEEMAADAERR